MSLAVSKASTSSSRSSIASSKKVELSSPRCSYVSEKIEGDVEVNPEGMPDFMAVFNVVMTAGGEGMLALTTATASVGYLPAIILLFVCGAIGWLMVYLLYCCRVMAQQLGMHVVMAYEDLGDAAFGRVGRIVVAVCLHISLIGTCCIVILLLGQNSYHLYDGISITWWVVIWAFLLLPLNWLKTMREIGYVSNTFGVVAVVMSVIGLTVGGFVQAAASDGDVEYVLGVSQPLSILAAYTTFSFAYAVTCGSTTVVHDMRIPSHAPKMFFYAFATITVQLGVVTAAAYLGWGQSLLCYGNVLDAMHKNVWGYISFASILGLCSTHYALLLHPSCRAIEVLAGLENGSPRAEKWGKWPTLVATCSLRSLLVAITAIITIAVPNFTLQVDYLSAVTYTLIHLVFPPLFYMRLKYLLSRHSKDEGSARDEGNFGSKRATMRSLSFIVLMLVAGVGSAWTLYQTIYPPASPEECSVLSS
ncbi:10 transmembrane domain, possible aa transporter, putative [Perkinsus marinus ATCC 50983]|uniref:10 transmembrane domain, possible aa transporter, putative n=1 Tax=Perkinsus marinus (strain ATCC 50983 / TXsc) TaxID=423536 RepID=C5KT76_PERM5|nr:10 transmembrane domain, possible aa transporter, putative [Perkinsus marinus ATCC 50983]EER12426.1 10 transmembrane domain, possible aa transporter, putative [Perkinsus marinus ATCC 50983]|eukprot:XP_002780631.1 10 transmembrane domain, possible aa transporter, putative [Perkinsus marinus ATCC 50983]